MNLGLKSSQRAEQLIAALLHLMSHYSIGTVLNRDRSVCTRLAAVIERHLKILAELPDLSPLLRATCSQLAEQWLLVLEQTATANFAASASSQWRKTTNLH